MKEENKNVDIDYEYSRKTYYELIEKSKESLDLMLEVAKESEHPCLLYTSDAADD